MATNVASIVLLRSRGIFGKARLYLSLELDLRELGPCTLSNVL